MKKLIIIVLFLGQSFSTSWGFDWSGGDDSSLSLLASLDGGGDDNSDNFSLLDSDQKGFEVLGDVQPYSYAVHPDTIFQTPSLIMPVAMPMREVASESKAEQPLQQNNTAFKSLKESGDKSISDLPDGLTLEFSGTASVSIGKFCFQNGVIKKCHLYSEDFTVTKDKEVTLVTEMVDTSRPFCYLASDKKGPYELKGKMITYKSSIPSKNGDAKGTLFAVDESYQENKDSQFLTFSCLNVGEEASVEDMMVAMGEFLDDASLIDGENSREKIDFDAMSLVSAMDEKEPPKEEEGEADVDHQDIDAIIASINMIGDNSGVDEEEKTAPTQIETEVPEAMVLTAPVQIEAEQLAEEEFVDAPQEIAKRPLKEGEISLSKGNFVPAKDGKAKLANLSEMTIKFSGLFESNYPTICFQEGQIKRCSKVTRKYQIIEDGKKENVDSIVMDNKPYCMVFSTGHGPDYGPKGTLVTYLVSNAEIQGGIKKTLFGTDGEYAENRAHEIFSFSCMKKGGGITIEDLKNALGPHLQELYIPSQQDDLNHTREQKCSTDDGDNWGPCVQLN